MPRKFIKVKLNVNKTIGIKQLCYLRTKRSMIMKFITKILDGLAYICVALLFLKYAVTSANMMFDWHLRWYF